MSLGKLFVTDAERGGQVLLLDGNGGFVEIPANETLNLANGDFDISAYANATDLTGVRVIASRWADPERSYMLALNEGKPELKLSTDGTDANVAVVTAPGAITANSWQKISATRTGSTLELKVDDTSVATGTFTGTVHPGAAPFKIGASSIAGEEGYFAGKLDDVRVKKSYPLQAAMQTGEFVYTYNTANQLRKEQTTDYINDYAYDSNGNNIQIVTTGTGAKTVTMVYDSLNRMTSWSDGTNTETNAYRGAEWHRVSTTANGTTTTYLYDGDNVVADIVDGSISKLYITPFLDQNLIMVDVGGGEDYYFSQDGLNSVRTITNASGVLVSRLDYTAFGQTYAENTVVGVDQRYGYTGRESSSVGAPMFYRNRSYNMAIGRFISRDPFGYNDGINVYSYVGNSPANWFDPFGNVATELDKHGAFGWLVSWPLLNEDATDYSTLARVYKPVIKIKCDCNDDGTWSLADNKKGILGMYEKNWIMTQAYVVAQSPTNNKIWDEHKSDGYELSRASTKRVKQIFQNKAFEFINEWKKWYEFNFSLMELEAKDKYKSEEVCKYQGNIMKDVILKRFKEKEEKIGIVKTWGPESRKSTNND